jgi:DNA replication and repair protein RecF
MRLSSLKIANYRNISETQLNLVPRVNIFVGDNGQGKTNFIEAIHLLVENQSFRYGDLATQIQFSKPYAVLNTVIHNNELEYSVQAQIFSDKKDVFLNGKRVRNLGKHLPGLVLFSPESLSVIKESSDERRALIDSLIRAVFPLGDLLLQEFKRALKSRNKVLRDFKDELIDRSLAESTLESLDITYFRLASEVVLLRLQALSEIRSEIQLQIRKIDQQKNVSFDYQYIISNQSMTEFSLEIVHNLISKRARELRSAELASGTSLVGPQKHDVIFLYNGKDSRFFCSQGQQRSIILAFKMAQIVYHHKAHGYYPILLLDDVLSELDAYKQKALVVALNEIQTQTFLTTTGVDVLSQLDMHQSHIFNIREGDITEG